MAPMPTSRSKPTARISSGLAGLRAAVLPITRSHRVRNVRVFGSFARGDQNKQSDVDLLVDLPNDMSLFELVGMKRELEAALDRKVDLVPAVNIKRALRERILADARPL